VFVVRFVAFVFGVFWFVDIDTCVSKEEGIEGC
jgi:hypothetical protein